MNLPKIKPDNPNFSSGPCAKRPNWSIDNLKNSLLGRSHRAVECKEKLKEVIDLSKSILNLPNNYFVGIMPASDTGALEAALWCLLGNKGIDILAWENFGKDWVLDVVDELKIIKESKIYTKKYLVIIHRESKSEDGLEKIIKILLTKTYGRSKLIFGTF